MLSFESVSLHFGGVTSLDRVSFDIRQGEILALIGPNGAGKTCILNCISGFYKPQSGRILFKGQEIQRLPGHKIAKMGIGRTFQNMEVYPGMSVIDNVMAARGLHIDYNPFLGLLYYGKARREEMRNRRFVEEIIDLMEMQPIRHEMVGFLPYGLRKRVDLARALALEPELLLLDEPMAGMNMEEKEDMARFVIDIHELNGTTILLVEHDMEVVMDIANRIVVLNFGEKLAEGTPEEISSNPEVIQAYLGEPRE
ncbi:MAG: ABC transporter ATP-binding protein [Proteobacteria bacterium]|nr:ABC transporter ATP-binding protein [Pseudomonadota bacterium]